MEEGSGRLSDGLVQRMRWCGLCILVCCGQQRAEPKDKGLCLPVDLGSYPHLWSPTVGSDRKKEIAEAAELVSSTG